MRAWLGVAMAAITATVGCTSEDRQPAAASPTVTVTITAKPEPAPSLDREAPALKAA